MKRHASRRCFAILFIWTCAVPLAYAFSPAQDNDRIQSPMRDSCPAACDSEVRSGVIGVYGGTVVDQLSSEAVVLVKWPDGSSRERWTDPSHGYRLPVDHATHSAHVFFLWPES